MRGKFHVPSVRFQVSSSRCDVRSARLVIHIADVRDSGWLWRFVSPVCGEGGLKPPHRRNLLVAESVEYSTVVPCAEAVNLTKITASFIIF